MLDVSAAHGFRNSAPPTNGLSLGRCALPLAPIHWSVPCVSSVGSFLHLKLGFGRVGLVPGRLAFLVVVVYLLSRVRLLRPRGLEPTRDSSVRGILRARILQWVAISFCTKKSPLLRNVLHFSTIPAVIYIPANSVGGFPLLHILANICYLCVCVCVL